MPPTTPRDFLKVAEQRLIVAYVLKEHRHTLDAQYIGGYVIECSLKALILEQTSEVEREGQLERLIKGSKMHKSEVLVEILRELGIAIPADVAPHFRKLERFRWSTSLRYETGRLDAGETTAFLRHVTEILNWVRGQLS